MATTRIKGITIEIGADPIKLIDSLKDVDKQINNTQSKLKDLNKLLKLDPTNTELLTQKQKALGDRIKEVEDRLKQLRDAQKYVARGTEEWDALQREIIDTEQQLKSAKKEFERFGSVGTQQLIAVGEKMKDIGNKISEVGGWFTNNLTTPIVNYGKTAIDKYAEVDKKMRLTNEIMGTSEQVAERVWNVMSGAAANSIFTMDEAAQATLNYARAGVKTSEDMESLLVPAMALAAGEGGNLDTVSQGLIASIHAFGGELSEAPQYADIMAAACNNSALEIDELSTSMRIAGPIFKAAGFTVSDAALYLGIMAENGIEANEGANALKTGFARLVSGGATVTPMLEKIGLYTEEAGNAFVTSTGDMVSASDALGLLQDAFSDLSESEQIEAASALFGKNQMSKWLAIINSSPESVEKLSNAISDCNGVTDEMSDAMMDGFGGSIEQVKASLDVLQTNIGRLTSKYLVPLINKVQVVVDWLLELDDADTEMIINIGLLVAAIGPVLTIVGKVITISGTLLTAIGSVASFLMISPIGLVAAITAAIAVGVALWKNWDTIVEKCQAMYDRCKRVWEDLKYLFSHPIQAAVNFVQTGSIHGADVSRYASAYDNPIMFTRPTVLQTPTGYKQFGDGNGAEIVMGLNKLRELVGTSGREVTNNITIYGAQGQNVNQLADIIIDKITAREERAAIGAL